MGTFTMTLNEVIQRIGSASVVDIALSNYPLFLEQYRPYLNGKIINHYLMREISGETIEMWALSVRRRMDEVMPVYNEYYHTMAMEFDPLQQIDFSSIMASGSQSDNTSNSNNSTKSVADTDGDTETVHKVYPSTPLSDLGDYASDGQSVKSTTGASNNVNAAVTDTGLVNNRSAVSNSSSGRQVDAMSLIQRYREMIVNVDLDIINDLSDCFMGIWSNGDSTRLEGNSLGFLQYGYGSGPFWL